MKEEDSDVYHIDPNYRVWMNDEYDILNNNELEKIQKDWDI